MKVQSIIYTDVNMDGTFSNGKKGAIVTKGQLIMSEDHGNTCSCGCSPGHWVTKSFPRTADGVVKVIKMTFSTLAEKKVFISNLNREEFNESYQTTN